MNNGSQQLGLISPSRQPPGREAAPRLVLLPVVTPEGAVRAILWPIPDTGSAHCEDADHNRAPWIGAADDRVGPRSAGGDRRPVFAQSRALTAAALNYDYQGLRVIKDAGGRIVRYVYDDDSVLIQTDNAGQTLAKYDYGPDRLLSLDHVTEGRQFYLFDALGSTVNLTKPDGAIQARYQYDAWGNFRAQAGSSFNRFTFTGHEQDTETNLYYFKARYYDPDTGRFLNQDPYLGDLNTPPSLHRYLYAYANPTVYVDPTGQATVLTGETIQKILEVADSEDEEATLRIRSRALRRVAEELGVDPGRVHPRSRVVIFNKETARAFAALIRRTRSGEGAPSAVLILEPDDAIGEAEKVALDFIGNTGTVMARLTIRQELEEIEKRRFVSRPGRAIDLSFEFEAAVEGAEARIREFPLNRLREKFARDRARSPFLKLTGGPAEFTLDLLADIVQDIRTASGEYPQPVREGARARLAGGAVVTATTGAFGRVAFTGAAARTASLSTGAKVRVFRVEGTPNTRIIIGESGEVAIQGEKTLFLNFGNRARAEEFLAQRLKQRLPGATLKSFEVPKSVLNDLRSTAVPERLSRQFPGRPILVDVTKAPDQFGLRREQIKRLQRAIIQGTGRVEK